MSQEESSYSRLLQVLLQTKDEPVLVHTAEDLATVGSNDFNTLTTDIRALNMEERGMELRDAARYSDYPIVHTILYVTAVLAGLSGGGAISNVTKPIPVIDDGIDIFSSNPIAIVRAATGVLELLHSADETSGNIALHMAAANNHCNIVQLLLRIEQASEEDIEFHLTVDLMPEKRPTTGSRLVQCVNQSGNTPLHYAITNRALESIQSLLTEYVPATENIKPMDVSDTPTLRYTNPSVDVLQKNSAGRSCLTEAFALSSASGASKDVDQLNHAILTLVLEHPSANEDRLLDVASGGDGNTKSSSTISSDDKQSSARQLPRHHTHQFRFVGSKSHGAEGVDLCIREMAMASSESPSSNGDQISILGGSEPMNDTTGYGIWSVSIIMAQWMTDVFRWNHRPGINGSVVKRIETAGAGSDGRWINVRTVLELGAGCGVPGLAIAKAISLSSEVTTNRDEIPTKVFLSDLNPETILNLQHNIELNELDHIASAVTMDWADLKDTSKIWPWSRTANVEDISCIDVLIGSDLVYQREAVPALIQTILQLRPQRFFYGAGRNRDGHDMFIDALSNSHCFVLISSQTAPKVFRSNNPLLNQDDDECFIHFQDLLLVHNSDSVDCDDTFTLYEFAWNATVD